jgi:hypothetical protein
VILAGQSRLLARPIRYPPSAELIRSLPFSLQLLGLADQFPQLLELR